MQLKIKCFKYFIKNINLIMANKMKILSGYNYGLVTSIYTLD